MVPARIPAARSRPRSKADTDEARTKARELIDDAREKLDGVVDAAVAAFDIAESSAARGAASRARAAAVEFRNAQALVLGAAYGGTGWSGRRAVQEELTYPLATMAVARSLRRNEDGSESATLLKAEDIPAVLYEDGKAVMGGDRLPTRGMPIILVTARQLRYGVSSATSPYDYPQRVV